MPVFPEFKITNENDWKFEFVISHEKVRRIRPKIYSKSAEKVSSCGVSSMGTQDPLASLFLTDDKYPSNKYSRELFSYNGWSDSRAEVSHYGDDLKTP